jgi:hypothetical protein
VGGTNANVSVRIDDAGRVILRVDDREVVLQESVRVIRAETYSPAEAAAYENLYVDLDLYDFSSDGR